MTPFLRGYGAVQAMPGPLFTFAAYLGTMIRQGSQAWIGGVVALMAIYLPGWLLMAGAYPFWHAIRAKGWAQTAIQGANAAVVGILLAALYRPVATGSVRNAWDVAAVAGAVVLLVVLRAAVGRGGAHGGARPVGPSLTAATRPSGPADGLAGWTRK